MWLLFFFFKQKSAYERRISDWISDVCSSDLGEHAGAFSRRAWLGARRHGLRRPRPAASGDAGVARPHQPRPRAGTDRKSVVKGKSVSVRGDLGGRRLINKIHSHYQYTLLYN